MEELGCGSRRSPMKGVCITDGLELPSWDDSEKEIDLIWFYLFILYVL